MPNYEPFLFRVSMARYGGNTKGLRLPDFSVSSPKTLKDD